MRMCSEIKPGGQRIDNSSAVDREKEIILSGIKRGNSFQSASGEVSVWYAAEDGRKEKMVDATTIGYKKIIDLQGVETDAIEIRIEDSRVAPVISFVGVY